MDRGREKMERVNSLSSSHSMEDVSVGGGTTSSAVGNGVPTTGGDMVNIAMSNTLGGGLPAGLVRRVQRDSDDVSVTSSITAMSGTADSDMNTTTSNNKPNASGVVGVSPSGVVPSVMVAYPGQPMMPIPPHQLSPGGTNLILGSPSQPQAFMPVVPSYQHPLFIPQPISDTGIALDNPDLNDEEDQVANNLALPLPSLDLFKGHIQQMKDQMLEKVHNNSQPLNNSTLVRSSSQNSPQNTYVKNASRIDKLSLLVVSSYQTFLEQVSRYEELINANSEVNTSNNVTSPSLEIRGRSRAVSAPRTSMPSKSPSSTSIDSRPRSISPRPPTSPEHLFPSKRTTSPQKIQGLPEPRKPQEKPTTPPASKVTRSPSLGSYKPPTENSRSRMSIPAATKISPSKREAPTIAELPNFNTSMDESPFDRPLPPPKRRSMSPNVGGKFQPSSSSGLYDRASSPSGQRDETKPTMSGRSVSASAVTRGRSSSTQPNATRSMTRSTSAPRPPSRTSSFRNSVRPQSSTGRASTSSPRRGLTTSPRRTSSFSNSTRSNAATAAKERAEKLKRLADSLPATQRLKQDTRGRLNKSTVSIQAKATTPGGTNSASKPQNQRNSLPTASPPGNRGISVNDVLNQVNSRRTSGTTTPNTATRKPSTGASTPRSSSASTVNSGVPSRTPPPSKPMQGASGRRSFTKGTASPYSSTIASPSSSSRTTPSSKTPEPRVDTHRRHVTPVQSTPQSKLTNAGTHTPVAGNGTSTNVHNGSTGLSPAVAALLASSSSSASPRKSIASESTNDQSQVTALPASAERIPSPVTIVTTPELQTQLQPENKENVTVSPLPIAITVEEVVPTIHENEKRPETPTKKDEVTIVPAASPSQPPPGGVKVLRQAFEESLQRSTSKNKGIVAPTTTQKAPLSVQNPSSQPTFVITGGKTTMIVGGSTPTYAKTPTNATTVSIVPPSISSSNSFDQQQQQSNGVNLSTSLPGSSDNLFILSNSSGNSNSGSNSGSHRGTPTSTPRNSLPKPLNASDIFGNNISSQLPPTPTASSTTPTTPINTSNPQSGGNSNNSSNHTTPRNSLSRNVSLGELKTVRPTLLKASSWNNTDPNNPSQGQSSPGGVSQRSSNLPEDLRKNFKRFTASDSHIIVGHPTPSPGSVGGSGSVGMFWDNLIPTDDEGLIPAGSMMDQSMNHYNNGDDDEVY